MSKDTLALIEEAVETGKPVVLEAPAAKPSRNIMIGIASYRGDLHYSTIMAINAASMEAAMNGWATQLLVRTLDANVPRARNVLFSSFVQGDATDLLFVDADVGWESGGFTRLMRHEVDLVGASYPARKDPEEFVLRSLGRELVLDPVRGLMEVEGLATGFMRITRNCAERLVEAHSDRWFRDQTAPGIDKIWCVFDFMLMDRQYWSEDYVFCRRWRALGGQVWCDPSIVMMHTGEKTWQGSLLDYLKRTQGAVAGAPQPQSLAAAARAMVEEAAE